MQRESALLSAITVFFPNKKNVGLFGVFNNIFRVIQQFFQEICTEIFRDFLISFFRFCFYLRLFVDFSLMMKKFFVFFVIVLLLEPVASTRFSKMLNRIAKAAAEKKAAAENAAAEKAAAEKAAAENAAAKKQTPARPSLRTQIEVPVEVIPVCSFCRKPALAPEDYFCRGCGQPLLQEPPRLDQVPLLNHGGVRL